MEHRLPFRLCFEGVAFLLFPASIRTGGCWPFSQAPCGCIKCRFHSVSLITASLNLNRMLGSQGNLPPKGSQYSTLWPTKLDKIKNLRIEVQAGLVIGGLPSPVKRKPEL